MWRLLLILVVVPAFCAGCGNSRGASGQNRAIPSTNPTTSSAERLAFLNAILHKDVIRVRQMLRANPTLARADSSSIMAYCLSSDEPAIVAALLEAGADPNARASDHTTALAIAMMEQRYDTAALLLAAGADPSAEGFWGTTPMSFAMEHGDKEMIAMLRAAGASEPSAATLKQCPDGHVHLRDVPVVYGFIRADDEFRQREANREVIRGGCMVQPTKMVVLCLDCSFSYDTYSNEWSRSSDDRGSFRRPFSRAITDLPFPPDAKATYQQTLWRSNGFADVLWFRTRQPADQVCDSIRKHLMNLGVETEMDVYPFEQKRSFEIKGKHEGKMLKVTITEHELTNDTSIHFGIGERYYSR